MAKRNILILKYIKQDILVFLYIGEKHFSSGMINEIEDDEGHFSHDCPT